MADSTLGMGSDTGAGTGSEVDPAVLDAAEAMLAADVEPDEDEPDDADEEEDEDEDEFQPAIAATTPFALTDAHEFPERSQAARKQEPPTAASTSLPPTAAAPPALPGTPLSPFRRCPCLAVLPGRVCQFCFSSRWTKFCLKCEGSGRISLSIRQGAERSQPCGNCMGRGTLPATPGEVRLAEEAALAAVAAGGAATVIAVPAPEYRRAVKLPGIGVTDHKKKPLSKAAKAAAAQRNESRKVARTAGAQGRG